MTINPVPPSDSPLPAESPSKSLKVKADFKALTDALNAGDISAAKKAFAKLQKSRGAKTDGSNSDSTESDFSKLATALKSGDISSAKKFVVALQKNITAGGRQSLKGSSAASQARQAQAASLAQESLETAAQTKSEAAKGDVQAMIKLARTDAANPQSSQSANRPKGTGENLDVLI